MPGRRGVRVQLRIGTVSLGMAWCGVAWEMSVTDVWPPKRPGPASDRDNVTRQTLRAGIRAPPPEKSYVSSMIGGTGSGTLGMVVFKNFNRCLLRELFRVVFAQTPPLQLPVAEPLDPHAS